MTTKRNTNQDRPPLSDEELRCLSAHDFGKVKLTEDEKSRLRAINDQRRQNIERKAAEWRKAEEPLAEELQAAGYDVESAWDLFNRKELWNRKERIKPYVDALPILVKHLQRTYPARVREGIARALAMPQAKFAWDVLVRLYRDEPETDAKDGLAVAIGAAADDSVLDQVIELVRDPHHGQSRLLMLSALERSSDPRARAALMELGTDPDLKEEIQVVLKRRKSKASESRK